MNSQNENPHKSTIRRCAYALMYEQGYSTTSYTDIAMRSGLGRPLVQRYFPKKEQFILDLIQDVSAICKRLLEEHESIQLPIVIRRLHLTQLYLSVLLCNQRAVSLTCDVLSDRKVTARIIDLHHRSAYAIFPNEDQAFLREASVRSMGGTYELMMDKHLRNENISPDNLAAQTMAAFLSFSQDAPYQDSYKDACANLLPEHVISQMVHALLNELPFTQ